MWWEVEARVRRRNSGRESCSTGLLCVQMATVAMLDLAEVESGTCIPTGCSKWVPRTQTLDIPLAAAHDINRQEVGSESDKNICCF